MITIIVVVIIIIIVVVTIVIVIVIIIMGTSGAAPATSERATVHLRLGTAGGCRRPSLRRDGAALVNRPVLVQPARAGARTHTAKSGSDPRPRPSSARSKSASQATPYGRRRAAVKTQPRVKRVRALSAAREEVGGGAHQSAT